jgi:hypothetical protein
MGWWLGLWLLSGAVVPIVWLLELMVRLVGRQRAGRAMSLASSPVVVEQGPFTTFVPRGEGASSRLGAMDRADEGGRLPTRRLP